MICALTVRKLKPGSFEQFRDAFLTPMADGQPPPGFTRFNMLRNPADPDEVVCLGFYDGTAEELRAKADEFGYNEQQEKIAPFVEAVGTDGLFEIAVDFTRD